MWDMQQGVVIGTVEAHQASVVSIAWSPDGRQFATASEDTAIHIWEVEL
jgi:WD40 repeat protein